VALHSGHFNSRKELLLPAAQEPEGLQVSLDLMIKEKYPCHFQELTFGCLDINGCFTE
jgi:hypothetical protein